MANLGIASLNVRGIRDLGKRRQIFQFLKEKQFDIILLQETHLVNEDELFFKTLWGGQVFYSHGERNARGVATLIARDAKVKIVDVSCDSQGRMIFLKINHEGDQYIVVNIYAPNADTPEFFAELDPKLFHSECENIIIGGDFNLVMDLKHDRLGGSNETSNKRAREVLERLMIEYDMVDIWRQRNPKIRQYTWARHNPETVMSRLDFYLVSQTVKNCVVNVDILPTIRSDHDIPTIMIKKTGAVRGPGFWKLNTSLLGNQEYTDQIKEIIKTEKAKVFETPTKKLEFIEFKVKEYTVKFASQKRRSKENKLKALERKILACQQELISIKEGIAQDLAGLPFSKQQILQHLDRLYSDREQILQEKVQSILIRNRRDWLIHGEKNSKLFFSLEKSRYLRKNRYQLMSSDGRLLDKNEDILQEQYYFYSQLYTAEEIDQELLASFLDAIELPQVTDVQNQMLTADITIAEVKEILWSMESNKIPGLQGLPPEFYRYFWEDLGQLVFYVLQEALEHGFPQTTSRGILSLMEKENRNLLELKNWRPLSLLNTIFKLLSKILAIRLNKILPDLIHSDQTGFRKGMGIADNLIELVTMLQEIENGSDPYLLLSFDILKAFDRVEWNVLWKIMYKYGFSEKYVQMVGKLFVDIQSCTVNLGYSSKYMDITRSLRQGDPISSSLFLLLIEVLGIQIRNDQNIRGMVINGKEKKIGQFADDLWSIIRGEQLVLNRLLQTVEGYCKAVGMKVNYDKTQIMRLGSLRNSNARFYTENQLFWSDGLKILGIEIRPTMQQMIQVNFSTLLEKIKQVLCKWKSRTLTLLGRILVVNTLAMSLATLKLTVLPTPPESFFEQAKKIIRSFIWKEKPAKIAYNRLIQDIGKGGTKLIDLKSKEESLKVAWIKKCYMEGYTPFWIEIANKRLRVKLREVINNNISPKDVHLLFDGKVNIMLQGILRPWYKLIHKEINSSSEVEEILHQNLWCNTYIKIRGRLVIKLPTLSKKVTKVLDIYHVKEKRFFHYAELHAKLGDIGNFMHYMAMVDAIPQGWKAKLKTVQDVHTQDSNMTDSTIQYIKTANKITKWVYGKFITMLNIPAEGARVKWNNELGTNYDIEEWEALRRNNYYMTISTKLRDFQFRILSCKTVTNVIRNKWDSQINPACTFCKNHSEIMTHLFFTCTKVKKIWSALSRWLNYHCKIKYTPELSTIITNDVKGSNAKLINTCILVTKQYVYSKKCANEQLKFIEASRKIHELYIDEMFLAKQNGNIKKHKKKWHGYELAFM